MLRIMSWDQLAEAVRARRVELGLKQVDVATAGHVSVDVIRNIEHRRRTPKRVNPRTARALEDALKWEPGSIEDTLAGGKPTPVPSTRQRRRASNTPPRGKPDATVQRSPTASAEMPDAENTTVSSGGAADSTDAPAGPDAGDRFALARQIVALRSTLSEHQRSISAEARDALMTEIANSAREAEETIVRILPWLSDSERGEAIDLLVKLREPLS
jgi:transcriptional regulator with XRE-family HTH domain